MTSASATLIHGRFTECSIPFSVKRIASDGRVFGVGGTPHKHDFTEVVVFTGGDGIHCVNGKEHVIQTGDVYVIEHVDWHYIRSPRNLTYTEVVFHPGFLRLPYDHLKQIPGYVSLFLPPDHSNFTSRPYARMLHLAPPQLTELDQIVERMYQEFHCRLVGHEASLQARLIELLVYLARAYPRTVGKEATTSALLEVNAIIESIQDDLTEQWSLEQLASVGNMSTSKLLVVFREATGMTPIEYLIRLRVRRAMFDLANTHESVTEIAYRVGFSDSNYFARQFRKNTGMSPTEFRKVAVHGGT